MKVRRRRFWMAFHTCYSHHEAVKSEFVFLRHFGPEIHRNKKPACIFLMRCNDRDVANFRIVTAASGNTKRRYSYRLCLWTSFVFLSRSQTPSIWTTSRTGTDCQTTTNRLVLDGDLACRQYHHRTAASRVRRRDAVAPIRLAAPRPLPVPSRRRTRRVPEDSANERQRLPPDDFEAIPTGRRCRFSRGQAPEAAGMEPAAVAGRHPDVGRTDTSRRRRPEEAAACGEESTKNWTPKTTRTRSRSTNYL